MLDERQLNSLDGLWSKGFQIEFHSHSKAILNIDYPTALGELDDVLGSLSIPIESLVRGGCENCRIEYGAAWETLVLSY